MNASPLGGSMFIIFETPLKAEDEMPSLGTKLSQAHLKPKWELKANKDKHQYLCLLPLPWLQCWGSGWQPPRYGWALPSWQILKEEWSEVTGRSPKHSFGLDSPNPRTLSPSITALISQLGLFSQQLTKAAEKIRVSILGSISHWSSRAVPMNYLLPIEWVLPSLAGTFCVRLPNGRTLWILISSPRK